MSQENTEWPNDEKKYKTRIPFLKCFSSFFKSAKKEIEQTS